MMLVTAGSRGDVEPFLALARRARDDGHDVRLGVTRDFVDAAEGAGVDVVPLDADFTALVAQQGVSAWAALRSYRSVVRPLMAAMLRSAAEAAVAFRPDVVVHHPKVLSAPIAAAHLGIPHVLVEIVPTLTPTREFPAAGVTTVDLGRFNRLTYRAAAGASRPFAGTLREIRARLGVPVRGRLPAPSLTLVPVSGVLLPRPSDWPDTTRITGPWHRPPADQPLDAELDAFLEAGDVVYAGFGSMATGDPVARGRAVVSAVRATGRRVLVAEGWGGLRIPADLAGDGVLVRAGVPHAAVLPRCSVAVHHGGAGTAHAAVRAGVVSVTVPFIADQPFWGALLHRRGLGAAPVAARRLTADRLGAALATLPGPGAAADAARAMAGEDGCRTALELLGRLS
ncbi:MULTISPECIES: glycosyltransferase [unclassified Geodermatophilus]